jgi:Icc-related predicted phosphoesterase
MQKEFVDHFLKKFFDECQKNKIKVLWFFGNDDLYFFKNEVRKLNDLLDETPAVMGEYEFKAYGFVPDYPFGLKTACKLDYAGKSLDEPYLSEPVCVNDDGLYYIDDIKKYFKNKGSIRKDLQKLKGDSNTIMAFHCPPDRVDLDVCGTYITHNYWIPRKKAGSESIYDWIERHQPKLVLCGHIHESFTVTKKWRASIGKTMIIQPGQLPGNTTMVAVEVGDHVQCDLIQKRTNYNEKANYMDI